MLGGMLGGMLAGARGGDAPGPGRKLGAERARPQPEG